MRLFCFLCLLITASYPLHAEPDYVWIEGEHPSHENYQTDKGGWGNDHVLSDKKWLHFVINGNKVPEEAPEEGVLLEYEFEVPHSGQYAFWQRVGYESVRSDYEWRIDDGPWTRVKAPRDHTIDMMGIADWAEVGWLDAGMVRLEKGEHTLSLRVLKQRTDKNKDKYHRMLFGADVFLFTRGDFYPNGPHKPDAQWRDERDQAALQHVFDLTNGKREGARTTLDLSGDWLYARYDEREIKDRTGPIPNLPETDMLHWQAIRVPAVREKELPDQWGAHRYFYRTRVRVPESMEGNSFVFQCAEASMLSTVFVNGKRVGFSDAAIAPFQFDVTDAIQPGQVNEIRVGIKDAYYAKTEQVRKNFHTPPSRTGGQGFTMDMDFPVARYMRSGLMDKVQLVSTGQAYVENLYIIPDVEKGRIVAEPKLVNSGKQAMTVEVRTHFIDAETGEKVKSLPPQKTELQAGESKHLQIGGNWSDPQLWWPDDPQLYEAVAEVYHKGKQLDRHQVRFGYRNWGIEGKRFTLNGIPWQFRANLDFYNARGGPKQRQEALSTWEKTGQNMFRLRFQFPWAGMTQNEALHFFDEQGIPVRKTVSTFDGQMASYKAVETIKENGKKKQVARKDLHDNWRKQIAARVKYQRNHPSVFVWELDNEVVYINNRNRGWLEETESEFTKAAEMIAELDRQGRGQMVGGGRALLDQSLPVNGTHYEASNLRDYPDMGYTLDEAWTGTSPKKPWPMALGKPIFLSEEFFASGPPPSYYSAVMGERAFAGRAEASEGIGLVARMYSEGYRWQALAAFHYWFSGHHDGYIHSWQPVLALVKEWNRTFASGAKVERTVMVRNDTQYDTPITFKWSFKDDEQTYASGEKELAIEPGLGEIVSIAATMPVVRDRQEGILHLICERGGETVWERKEDFSIINPDAAPIPDVGANDLIVWDDSGSVSSRLRDRDILHRNIDSLEAIPQDYRLLIVGPDTIPEEKSTKQWWLEEAIDDHRIMVLDQQYPLQYHATLADAKGTTHNGRFAFSQDSNHPVFDGLKQSDLSLWSGDHVVYRHIYEKPTVGGKSLIHADDKLGYSAMIQSPTENGLMLLSQMAVGSKLKTEPVAQRLFDNMLNHALTYELIERPAEMLLQQSDPRAELIADTGAAVSQGESLEKALSGNGSKVVIAEASKSNLETLLENKDMLRAFTERGADLMLWNLAPDGLELFNELVGYDHLIRPGAREKVTIRLPRHPLATGMSQSDLRLSAGSIQAHQRIEWVVDDLFTHVLDLNEIVPFLEGPGIEPDHNGGSIANGFTDVENWRYGHYIGMEDGKAKVYEYTLPKPETITSLKIRPNSHYHKIRETKVTFHKKNGQHQVETLELEPFTRKDNPRQDFDLRAENVERITMEFTRLEEGSKPITGIDNLWIHVERPSHYHQRVKPLLNSGGIIYYPMGEGGILLNQLNVKENEQRPSHKEKKQSVIASLLRNVEVEFPTRRIILPGEGMRTDPVSLEAKANVYLTKDQGWPNRFETLTGGEDLYHLPIGERTFRGIQFNIRDFLTSPLENGIGLGKRANLPEKISNIEVGRKADALFFLHTLIADKARDWLGDSGWQKKMPEPVIWNYLVHYADGQKKIAKVVLGKGVHQIVRKDGKLLDMENAKVAWAAPFDEDKPDKKAAIYTMQWNNPRPNVAIEHIDIILDPQRDDWWGQPLILGISTGEMIQ